MFNETDREKDGENGKGSSWHSEPRRSVRRSEGGVGDDGKIKIIDKLQGLSQVCVGRAVNFRWTRDDAS